MSDTRTSLRTRTRTLVATIGALTFTFLVGSPSYAAAPTNDNIEQATVITSVPFEDTVDTTDATETEGEYGIATVWYTFTPSTDRAFVVRDSLPDHCYFVAVFEGEPGYPNQIGYADSCMGYPEVAVRVVPSAGSTYYITGGTSWADEGAPRGGLLTMTVDHAPPPVEATVTIDPVAHLSKDGRSATVSGTIVCNTPATATVDVSVLQRQGLNLAQAGFQLVTPCSSAPSHWSQAATSWSRILLPKRASANAWVYAQDEWTYFTDEVTGPLTLTRRR